MDPYHYEQQQQQQQQQQEVREQQEVDDGSHVHHHYAGRGSRGPSSPSISSSYSSRNSSSAAGGSCAYHNNNKSSYYYNNSNGSKNNNNRRHQWHNNNRNNRSSHSSRSFRSTRSCHTSSSCSSSEHRLQELLYEYGCVSVDDTPRQMALYCLEKLLAEWAQLQLEEEEEDGGDDGSNSTATATGVALIPFGSYRLNVHRPTSDLDVLALAPPNCSRENFSGTFVEMLKQDPHFQRVHPITTAYTPVIKFEYVVIAADSNINNNTPSTIPIDMLFAHSHNPTKLLQVRTQRQDFYESPEEDPYYHIDDSDLIHIMLPYSSSSDNNNTINTNTEAAASVRSLNGVRVTQMLIEMVPNADVYRIVLRAVNQWAISKGLYSNALGFLGGVNYAIMVAWVCLNYPPEDNNAELLFERFFQTFAVWDWPTPVMLCPLQEDPPTTNGSNSTMTKLPSWNPVKNKRDRSHIMPIITPTYPSMNSSYNVGHPQLRRIRDEMLKAATLLRCNYGRRHGDKVLRMILSPPSSSSKRSFFRTHKLYLQVTLTTTKKKGDANGGDGANHHDSHQEHIEWLRLLESRLRLLYLDLESDGVQAWPYARSFTHDDDDDDETTGYCPSNNDEEKKHRTSFFIGLRLSEGLHKVDLHNLTADFMASANSWTGHAKHVKLQLSHVMEEDLPYFAVTSGQSKNNKNIRPTHRQHPLSVASSYSRDNDDDDDCSKASAPLTLSLSNSSLTSSFHSGSTGYARGRGHQQAPQLPREVGIVKPQQQAPPPPQLSAPDMEHSPPIIFVAPSAA